MATEIRVPSLGESISEVTIGQWFKNAGDPVEADEPLVELETDKVTQEIPAPASGTLASISAAPGDTLAIGDLLGVIAPGGAAAAPARGKGNGAADNAPVDSLPPAPQAAAASGPLPGAAPHAGTAMPPSPAARKHGAEAGMDLATLSGSGRRGQVLKEDVLSAIPAAAAATAATPEARAPDTPAGTDRRVAMSRLRQTIARRLKEAQNTAAMLSTFNEVDMGALMDMRRRYRELFEKKHGVKLGFMGFFTKAVCHALGEIPAINARIEGTDIVYPAACHIGIAVGTDKGLVVPVLRNADSLSIAGIECAIAALGARAREGMLDIADMQGGTFTISNGGVYGSLLSTPILNAPQSGILGMHKIQERPVVVDGNIVIRPMMYLALSYDHRIVDGKEAVTFLVRVKESLENIERLVLDL